jgi:hypothetical protein
LIAENSRRFPSFPDSPWFANAVLYRPADRSEHELTRQPRGEKFDIVSHTINVVVLSALPAPFSEAMHFQNGS